MPPRDPGGTIDHNRWPLLMLYQSQVGLPFPPFPTLCRAPRRWRTWSARWSARRKRSSGCSRCPWWSVNSPRWSTRTMASSPPRQANRAGWGTVMWEKHTLPSAWLDEWSEGLGGWAFLIFFGFVPVGFVMEDDCINLSFWEDLALQCLTAIKPYQQGQAPLVGQDSPT